MSQFIIHHSSVITLGVEQQTPGLHLLATELDAPSPRGRYVRFIKPAVDRIGAGIALIVLSPILSAAIALTRISLGRPIFYQQVRVGKDGVPFTMLKIRTMRPDRRSGQQAHSGPDRRANHKSEADPRHTVVGRQLRRYSIDELPQLLNVLRGEMSLVGPRPEISEVAERGNLIDHPRHMVKPGVTGPWQISSSRGENILEGLHHDEEYVRQVSFRTDLCIALATPRALFTNPGK